ncbi:MAG: transcription-repair coupling factor [Ruminococcaceae bacterium]|nr:transcription-repair coupling factor [Oscillospiraceae bacterium]
MEYFTKLAQNIPEYVRAEKAMKNYERPSLITGLAGIHKAHLLSRLALCGEAPVLVITKSEADAARLVSDINTLSGSERAVLFPAKDMILGETEAISGEYTFRRIDALYKLSQGLVPMAVCSPDSAVQLTLSQKILEENSVTLKKGNEYNLTELVQKLIFAGFSRFEAVESRGQISVRGSILDIFPVNSDKPVRIEFWGDEIDQMAYFETDTQRRTEDVEEIRIAPNTEQLIEKEALIEKIEALISKQKGKNADKVVKNLKRDLNRLKDGLSIMGDKYFPLYCPDAASIFDYVKTVIICENSGCNENLRAALSQHTEEMKLLFEEGSLCKGLDRYCLSKGEYAEKLNAKLRLYLDNFIRGGGLSLDNIIPVAANSVSLWGGEYGILKEQLSDYIDNNYSISLFAGTEKGAKNLAEDLTNDGFPAEYFANPNKPVKNKIVILSGMLSSGFDYPDAKYVCLSHTAVTSVKKAAPKRKKAEIINSLDEIGVGELVVHNSYGIGVFKGVENIRDGKINKDYIKIQYAGTDVLYVPVTQLDLISRYIGSADTNTVKLSKLHTDQWQKAKTKAKAAAKEMAEELTQLYAKRLKSKGHAFSPDDRDQEEFENRFNYVETDDQLRCAAEIKSDMERESPMDRLLCGDVGFGKTEVALRGAFKCVMDGKQCALLCPTTVLAWQHYQTVLRRFEGYPVKIALLSRFITAKEQKQVLEQLKKGMVDMIIGTHRLVQKDVEFKDLGLVIIDEEQRFGVAHKEKFKEMFSGVDILTLSATPIPRTLNMAMTGIRDMSVLETPPQDRQPITTFVMEHDWGVIAAAINKELRRNGQVYYIHNRVESIVSCAAKLQELVPEAVIGIAHGKMEEDELLEVWSKLLNGEINLLVCTTLIETGVDVPNCNTLIIESAENMGLAQLHQLRGRVGRTNRRAFAYFTFKKGKVLSEIATKRLEAIREFTKFGSGFRIAMRDLEIRGAGSILGAHQSGHLTAVGYDMYLKLLDQAVKERNGEQPKEEKACLIDLKIDAYIPETYVPSSAQRITCYRKIASIKTEQDSLDVTDELIDRYGDVPKSVYTLIKIAMLRSKAEGAKIDEIVQSGDNILFYTESLDLEKAAACSDLFKDRFSLNMTGRVNVRIKLGAKDEPLEVMREFLDNYSA